MNVLTRYLTFGLVAAAIGGALYLALREQPILIDIAFATRGPMQVTINEEGVTRVRDIYEISSPITGHLQRVVLEEGDAIKANETVVATIHPLDPPFIDERATRELTAAIEAARSAVKLAEVNYSRAQADLILAETIFKRGLELERRDVVSSAELDERQNTVLLRRAEVDSAKATIDLKRAELKRAEARRMQPAPKSSDYGENCCIEITAPIDGIILKVIAKSEKVVSSSMVIAEAGDPRNIEIAVDLLSSDAVKIAPKSTVLINEWGGDKLLKATVRRIDPSGFMKVSALGIEEQRVNAVLDLEDVPPALGHGYRVFANFVIWSKEDALQVPIGALFRSNGNWVVFKVEEDKAILTPVTIGQMNDSHAEILNGLSEKAEVVLYPNDQLKDGGLIERR